MLPALKPITVLIAIPNEITRAGLRWFFNKDQRFRLLAATGSEGAALAHKLQPDLIVADPARAGQLNVAIIDELRQAAPDAAIVILTSHFDLGSFTAAVHGGVLGYFLPAFAADGEALLDTLVPVGRWGIASSDPAVARIIQLAFGTAVQLLDPQGSGTILTARQQEVPRLHLRNMSDKAIAERLHIDRSTVEDHIEQASHKVGVNDRIYLGWLLRDRQLLWPA
jgi:two-component system nitrate/nitrite response regulator NarL